MPRIFKDLFPTLQTIEEAQMLLASSPTDVVAERERRRIALASLATQADHKCRPKVVSAQELRGQVGRVVLRSEK